ncbi:MAG: DUF393 domain-containing protein [Myxococcales bacterium]|nr:DUF393 domain-containing protein [Myxococcales bacterium]
MDHALTSSSAPAYPADAHGHDVILVDGLCVFCNRLVASIARHDKRGRFLFTHIQSALGQAILTRHGHDPSDIDTVYLVTELGTPRERLHLDGEAGRIIWPSLFRIAIVLRLVPLFLLNLQYRLFARVRYRLFGASSTCIVPTEALRARVLGGSASMASEESTPHPLSRELARSPAPPTGHQGSPAAR